MRRQDMTGKRFGMLTVLKRVPRSESPTHYPSCLVRCDCGNEKVVTTSNLKGGYITSCGCVRKAAALCRVSGENILGYYDGTTISKLRAMVTGDKVRGIIREKQPDGSTIYRVCIELQGRRIYCGRYKDYPSAVEARRKAEQKYYIPIIEEWDRTHK